MFLLLLITVEVKTTLCNSLITMFTTSWRNSIKIGWSKLYIILSFLQKAVSHVKHSDISWAPFWKRFLQVKQFHDAKVVNTRLPSFVIPKNYGSLTHETRIKDVVNMNDLIWLLTTVRTLKEAKLVLMLKMLKQKLENKTKTKQKKTKKKKKQLHHHGTFLKVNC